MIYLDSSALMKLLFEEDESAALAQWLADHAGTPVITSELAKVEVVRAARRLDAAVVPAARALISQLDLIPLSGDMIDQSADAGDNELRSLDAIHLASMLSIREHLVAFVGYDNRLVSAAEAVGIDVVRPS